MITSVTTRACSPLGRLLALAIITAALLYAGLYLATDGGVNLKILAFLSAYSTVGMQDRQRELLQAISDHFKKFERVELLVLYGLAIFAGFLCHSLIGGFMRSYRFSFLPDQRVVERQALWLCIPVWALVWLGMGLILLLVLGGRTATVRLPVWLWLSLAAPGLVAACAGAWYPQWLAWRPVAIPRVGVRAPIWMMVLLGVAVVTMLVGLLCGWTVSLGVPVPAWVLAALLIPPLAIIPGFIIRPALAGRLLYIPGRRKRVAFVEIQRLEVESQADGGAALVLMFANRVCWTIRRDSLTNLQRLGRGLGRIIGLKRMDLVTWE